MTEATPMMIQRLERAVRILLARMLRRALSRCSSMGMGIFLRYRIA